MYPSALHSPYLELYKHVALLSKVHDVASCCQMIFLHQVSDNIAKEALGR